MLAMKVMGRSVAIFLTVVMIFGNVTVMAFENSFDDYPDSDVPAEVLFDGEAFSDIPFDDISDCQNIERNLLTGTLGRPVGMQGFEGAYALSGNPNDIVEIIVQFRTPPAVALRLMGEREIPNGRDDILDGVDTSLC